MMANMNMNTTRSWQQGSDFVSADTTIMHSGIIIVICNPRHVIQYIILDQGRTCSPMQDVSTRKGQLTLFLKITAFFN